MSDADLGTSDKLQRRRERMTASQRLDLIRDLAIAVDSASAFSIKGALARDSFALAWSLANGSMYLVHPRTKLARVLKRRFIGDKEMMAHVEFG